MILPVGASKKIVFVGPTKKDIRAFPDEVSTHIGFALRFAQLGGKHPHAKPLRGFGGAGVLEIVSDHAGDTYRAAYTVQLANAIYVLHAFQKKSTKKSETPKPDIDLIKSRLTEAKKIDGKSSAPKKLKK